MRPGADAEQKICVTPEVPFLLRPPGLKAKTCPVRGPVAPGISVQVSLDPQP